MKSKTVVYIALASDAVIAITKFIGVAISGSSAMLSEGIHSVIDAITQVLLLWGIRESHKKPDERRPFGYGRELYFWSFIVSLIIFTLGGSISLFEGLQHLKKPSLPGNVLWNYIVLGIAFVFTSLSAMVSLRKFNKERKGASFWSAIRDSKDPSTFIVLLGDMGDLLGLPIAFSGIFLTKTFRNDYYDSFASIIIGIILILVSFVLLKESRSLLMGEAPAKSTLKKIILLAESDAAVRKVKQHFSIYLAPEEVVLQLITVFKDNLTTQQITEAVDRISKKIQEKYPRIKKVFIEPATV